MTDMVIPLPPPPLEGEGRFGHCDIGNWLLSVIWDLIIGIL
jgi:hypothetical protein